MIKTAGAKIRDDFNKNQKIESPYPPPLPPHTHTLPCTQTPYLEARFIGLALGVHQHVYTDVYISIGWGGGEGATNFANLDKFLPWLMPRVSCDLDTQSQDGAQTAPSISEDKQKGKTAAIKDIWMCFFSQGGGCKNKSQLEHVANHDQISFPPLRQPPTVLSASHLENCYSQQGTACLNVALAIY